MTDYKNELEQALEKLKFTVLNLKVTEKDWQSDIFFEVTSEFRQAIEALLSKRELEAEKRGRIKELQRIHKNIAVTEWNDGEYEYWCENCTMLLIEKDDICACERLTKDRVNQLTNREEK